MVDAIVVGSGAGGGAAAFALAAGGLNVLILEQGGSLPVASRESGHPLGAPIQGQSRSGSHPRAVNSDDGLYYFVGGIGGGTAVWGMQAWRFHPDDFRMASLYGVPAGSSLADWPISYDELEPWYGRAESELGVAGESTPYAPRSSPYPMGPLQRDLAADWLAHGATKSGWSSFTPPLAVNSQPVDGRQACIRCDSCLGFPCPVDAKNGSHNTFIPRALAIGNCELIDQAQVTELLTDGSGRVTGVEYAKDQAGSRTRHRVNARLVFLAGGAIETARLLLGSRSRHHPAGIGNAHDHVGRHLQSHTYAAAVGTSAALGHRELSGPGVGVAITDYCHGNPGVIGGAMMAQDFFKPPAAFRRSLPRELGASRALTEPELQNLYEQAVEVRAPIHEVPMPSNRVLLDPRIRDAHGQPIARTTGHVHPETARTTGFMRDRLRHWLRMSGADRTWFPVDEPRVISDWFHQAGTCRMSNEPSEGVVDTSSRIHGHDNLFVVDGSVHVTNGGFNPALTIFALALRAANNALAAT